MLEEELSVERDAVEAIVEAGFEEDCCGCRPPRESLSLLLPPPPKFWEEGLLLDVFSLMIHIFIFLSRLPEISVEWTNLRQVIFFS